jgi:hypothetical protein
MPLTDDMVLDRAKAELRLLGRRQAAVDLEALCDHLDSLVGPVVGEVIMNNLESRLGNEDAARLRERFPNASVDELVGKLAEADLVSGMGITKVALNKAQDVPVTVEIWNPIVKANKGAAKSFLFSWWCGALTSLLGEEMEVRDVHYDEERNVIMCEIARRTKARVSDPFQ